MPFFGCSRPSISTYGGSPRAPFASKSDSSTPSGTTTPCCNRSADFGQTLLRERRVVDGSRLIQHAPRAEAPQHLLFDRLLPEAPGVERAERPHDVRHSPSAARRSRRQAGVREHGVDVDDVESGDVIHQPAGERSRILEGLAPLAREKDRRYARPLDAGAVRYAQARGTVGIGRGDLNGDAGVLERVAHPDHCRAGSTIARRN